MVIEGQVRFKCDAEVLGGSYCLYRYEILTKTRYGDVTGQLGDKLPHSKQNKLDYVRTNQKQLGEDMTQYLLTQTRNLC